MCPRGIVECTTMLLIGQLAAVQSAAQPSAAAATTDATGASRYLWDLSPLYADDNAWDAERAAIQRDLGAVRGYSGTLGRSARSLADALDAVSDLRGRASRLAVYGVLRQTVDSGSHTARSQAATGTVVEAEVEAAVGFVRNEIPTIGQARLTDWMQVEPRLARHQQRINRVLLEAPHALAPEAQPLLESLTSWSRQPSRTFEALSEGPLDWPTVRGADGQPIVIQPSSFEFYRVRSWPSRESWNETAGALRTRLNALEDIYGNLLVGRIQSELTLARHQGFDDGIVAFWFMRDAMPPDVPRLILRTADENLETLQRYVRLRQRALRLEQMTYDDLWAPPPQIERRFTVTEGMELAIASAAPFGAQYQAAMRRVTTQPWFHLPPLPGKRTTFSVNPSANAPPYMVQTFRGDLRNVRGLAGALGSMVIWDERNRRGRALDTRDDPATFGNAAVFVSNMLLEDYLRNRATARPERIAYLLMSLDRIRETFFHPALASAFESAVQDSLCAGHVPSGALLSQLFRDLLRHYYGHELGILQIDDALGAEWMTREVSFLSYEGQIFPASMAAAAMVVERMRAGEDVGRLFMEAPAAAPIDRSYQLLQHAGIDMALQAPYEAPIRRMNSLMDELERELQASTTPGGR